MKILLTDTPLFKLALSLPLCCDTTVNTATLISKTIAICAVSSGYVLSITYLFTLSYRLAYKSLRLGCHGPRLDVIRS